MCSIESVELEIAEKEVERLKQENDDYRQFVKSAYSFFQKTCIEDNSWIDKYNMKTMSNFLYHRYQPTNEE